LVSEVKAGEITEAEKRELALKVYPRLKRRGRFFRLFRFGNAVLGILFITACATAEKPAVDDLQKSKKLSIQIKKGLVKGADPEAFETKMPTSDITLSSIIKFTKEPTIKPVGDNVIDMDYEMGTLVLLKEDRLETNNINCPTVLLPEDKYLSVRMERGLALITGAKKALTADIMQCGTIYETDAPGRGFSISSDYLLEFTRNSFELYDARRTEKVQGGSFLGNVAAGLLSGGNIMFANENGKIALMSGDTGRYTAIYPGVMNIKQIAFEDAVYIYNTDNRLIRLRPDLKSGTLNEDGTTQGKDGCFFLKRSGRLFCDGYILGIDSAYESPVNADAGLIRDGLIFLLRDGELFFVDVTLTYKKSLVMAPDKERLCLKEGRAFFKDFDGGVKYITASGAEKKGEEMPEVCDHRFDFDGGALKRPDGKEIYRFADIVNRSEKALMLKRRIGENIYYYFEKLSE